MTEYQLKNDVQSKINYLLNKPQPQPIYDIQSKINYLLSTRIPPVISSQIIPPQISPVIPSQIPSVIPSQIPSVISPQIIPSVISPQIPSVISPSGTVITEGTGVKGIIDSIDSKLYDGLIRTTDINNGIIKTRDEMFKVDDKKLIIDVKSSN